MLQLTLFPLPRMLLPFSFSQRGLALELWPSRACSRRLQTAFPVPHVRLGCGSSQALLAPPWAPSVAATPDCGAASVHMLTVPTGFSHLKIFPNLFHKIKKCTLIDRKVLDKSSKGDELQLLPAWLRAAAWLSGASLPAGPPASVPSACSPPPDSWCFSYLEFRGCLSNLFISMLSQGSD